MSIQDRTPGRAGADRRTARIDTLLRLAQPLNVVAIPVLIRQGRRVRVNMPRLPQAAGPTEGTVSGREPDVHITLLGDSAAAGVGAASHSEAMAGYLCAGVAERTHRQVSWRVIANSGATTRSVSADLVPRLDHWADVVVVMVGGNDLKRYRRIGAFRSDTRTLIGKIRHRAGSVPIVLAGIPPFQHMPGLPRAMRTILGLRGRAMDDVLRRLARRTPGVRHVATASRSRMADGAFSSDGFHLAGKGYQAWAESLADDVVAAHRPTP